MFTQASEQQCPNVFVEHLALGSVACRVDTDKQKRVLQTVATLLQSQVQDVSSQDIMEQLVAREKLGSCNLGHGIALPHARLENITQPALALMTLKEPIKYDDFDKQAVDIVCGLIIPENSSEDHLTILAELAGFFKDKNFCQQLRVAENNEQLLDAALNWPHEVC